MTTLKDLINDFGKRVAEIEADENINEVEANDLYEEALDETMETIAKRLIGLD